MATEAQVRKYLDPEEPDYAAAAAALGPDALPVLETLVRSADPLLASKAAYLAAFLPHGDADRVLEQAAQSSQPTVRVAAAAGLQQRPTSNPSAARLAADPDPGVRKVAAKAARAKAKATPTGSYDAAPSAPRQPAAQPTEGEHGGGFSPEPAGRRDDAPGEGGGDLGATTASSGVATGEIEQEGGGGGDLGGGHASASSHGDAVGLGGGRLD